MTTTATQAALRSGNSDKIGDSREPRWRRLEWRVNKMDKCRRYTNNKQVRSNIYLLYINKTRHQGEPGELLVSWSPIAMRTGHISRLGGSEASVVSVSPWVPEAPVSRPAHVCL